MVVVLMANGYEDIEAMTIIDVLRQGGENVSTVGIGGKEIISASNVKMMCEYVDNEFDYTGMKMLVLPGGFDGVNNLDNSSYAKEAINYAVENDIWIGAICMAPLILGKMGLMTGRNVTSFPDAKEFLLDANHTEKTAEMDGKIITGQCPAGSLDFSFMLLEALKSKEHCDELKMNYHYCGMKNELL